MLVRLQRVTEDRQKGRESCSLSCSPCSSQRAREKGRNSNTSLDFRGQGRDRRKWTRRSVLVCDSPLSSLRVCLLGLGFAELHPEGEGKKSHPVLKKVFSKRTHDKMVNVLQKMYKDVPREEINEQLHGVMVSHKHKSVLLSLLLFRTLYDRRQRKNERARSVVRWADSPRQRTYEDEGSLLVCTGLSNLQHTPVASEVHLVVGLHARCRRQSHRHSSG